MHYKVTHTSRTCVSSGSHTNVGVQKIVAARNRPINNNGVVRAGSKKVNVTVLNSRNSYRNPPPKLTQRRASIQHSLECLGKQGVLFMDCHPCPKCEAARKSIEERKPVRKLLEKLPLNKSGSVEEYGDDDIPF